jgi:hypothetical protein
MTDEQVFMATRKVYALYGAFFKAVSQEVGLDRALALHAQAHEEQGVASGKLLKEKLGDRELDLRELGSILQQSNLSIGIDSQLSHADASSVVFSNARCPMYDGYRMGGLDDETAEALCQRGAPAKLGAMLQLLDPGISYRLTRYRSNPEEPCEEEVFRTNARSPIDSRMGEAR